MRTHWKPLGYQSCEFPKALGLGILAGCIAGCVKGSWQLAFSHETRQHARCVFMQNCLVVNILALATFMSAAMCHLSSCKCCILRESAAATWLSLSKVCFLGTLHWQLLFGCIRLSSCSSYASDAVAVAPVEISLSTSAGLAKVLMTGMLGLPCEIWAIIATWMIVYNTPGSRGLDRHACFPGSLRACGRQARCQHQDGRCPGTWLVPQHGSTALTA